MSAIQRRCEFVRRKMDLLDAEQAQCLIDREVPLEAFTRQELCYDAIEVFEDLCRLDEHWHISVYNNPDSYDDAIAESLLELFRSWHEIGRRVLSFVERNQQPVDGVDEGLVQLTACCDQCQALLNPSEAETSLADEALALHRSGATEEL
jgi:hypothetical protein